MLLAILNRSEIESTVIYFKTNAFIQCLLSYPVCYVLILVHMCMYIEGFFHYIGFVMLNLG